jgi:hypothetical protein
MENSSLPFFHNGLKIESIQQQQTKQQPYSTINNSEQGQQTTKQNKTNNNFVFFIMNEQELESMEINGAEVFAHHLLHEEEYGDEAINPQYHTHRPSSPPMSPMHRSQLNAMEPGSPKYHVKDNLELPGGVPGGKGASAKTFAKHLLHDLEYSPQAVAESHPECHIHNNIADSDDNDNNNDADADDAEPVGVVPPPEYHRNNNKVQFVPQVPSEYKLCHQSSPKSPNRHLKDQYVPYVPTKLDPPLYRRHSEPELVIVSPLPIDEPSKQLKNDSSTLSIANSQDCASLGSSLSYAGHFKKPPLLDI